MPLAIRSVTMWTLPPGPSQFTSGFLQRRCITLSRLRHTHLVIYFRQLGPACETGDAVDGGVWWVNYDVVDHDEELLLVVAKHVAEVLWGAADDADMVRQSVACLEHSEGIGAFGRDSDEGRLLPCVNAEHLVVGYAHGYLTKHAMQL